MKGLLGFLFLSMPVILAGGWLVLTWLLAKGALRLLGSTFANRAVRVALVVIVAMFWFGGAFWEVAGKKMYWDAKVRELCAQDGGVKVYETVELPGERFDKYGVLKIPSGKDAKLGGEYHYESKIYYYKKGSPEIWRLHFEIFRNSDNKLLGEATSYARRGGDIPGPWHESSFSCPEQSDISDLKKQVFIKIGMGVRHE
jgi:hypothetical protein